MKPKNQTHKPRRWRFQCQRCGGYTNAANRWEAGRLLLSSCRRADPHHDPLPHQQPEEGAPADAVLDAFGVVA